METDGSSGNGNRQSRQQSIVAELEQLAAEREHRAGQIDEKLVVVVESGRTLASDHLKQRVNQHLERLAGSLTVWHH